jgi:hypothetical protein
MNAIEYIQVDETHRIEIMPSGNYYPQHLINPAWKDHYEGWGYYKVGCNNKKFRSEKGARTFLAKSGNASYLKGGYGRH